MSNDKPRPRSPAGFSTEEKKACAAFYARVGKDPLLAAELIAQLDKDVELKRTHLALYLSSKEAIPGFWLVNTILMWCERSKFPKRRVVPGNWIFPASWIA